VPGSVYEPTTQPNQPDGPALQTDEAQSDIKANSANHQTAGAASNGGRSTSEDGALPIAASW